MSCDEFQGSYELYALDLLEEPERSELQEHLDRACPVCVANVRQARLFNASFLASAAMVTPPGRLRHRVLASSGIQPSFWGQALRWSPLLAGLLLAIVWISYQKQLGDADLAAARVMNERNAMELQRARQVMDLLNQPETRQVIFGQGAPQPPRGRIFVNSQKGVVLLAHNLPPLPSGHTFEMWLIPKGGAPRPAGLFQSGADNAAVHVQPGRVDPALAAVAVTIEPATGSPAPTTQPLFAAPVGL